MRAITQHVEFPKYINVEEPSTSGRLLGILPDDSPTSFLKKDDLVHLRSTYGIPDNIEQRKAKEHERTD